jgi:DNA primase
MALIPEETVREVLDRADIVEVVGAYVPLRKAGRNFKAPCPFHHEKTPSFVVNPHKQIFHCFGCGVGGNVLSFLMQQERFNFPEAVRQLAARYGVSMKEETPGSAEQKNLSDKLKEINALAVKYFQQNLLSSRRPDASQARQYLKNRGVDLEAVKAFNIGFALDEWDGIIQFLGRQNVSLGSMEQAGLIIPRVNSQGYYDRFRNRVIFPIIDVRDQCLAFGARTLAVDETAKYINSPETAVYSKGHVVFGLSQAKESIAQQDEVIIVEGYLDCITPHRYGIKNVVAACGTALSVDQIRLLKRYTDNVIMLFDGDSAGQGAILRSLDLLIEEQMHVRVAQLAEGEDPDSFIRRFGREEFLVRINSAESLFDFKLKSLLKRWPVNSIETRAKISEEMLATVDKFQNAIIKSEYLKKLAQRLAVSPEALLQQLKKRQTSAGKFNAEQPDRKVFPVSSLLDIRPVERDILRLLLEEKSFIPLTQQEVELTDFYNEPIRSLVAKIFELFSMDCEISTTRLMSCLEDQSVIQVLTALTTEDYIIVGDKNRILRDCIRRIQEDRLKRNRQDLLKQMEEAQLSGDGFKMENLTQQFNQLINKR